MKRYKDKQTGKVIVEVDDLSFLSERNHPYNWFQRHFYHHRLRLWLRRTGEVLVPDQKTAAEVSRYYFFPKDRIKVIGRS